MSRSGEKTLFTDSKVKIEAQVVGAINNATRAAQRSILRRRDDNDNIR